MKIYTSNYRNHWLSPYTMWKWMNFWRPEYHVFDDGNEPPEFLTWIAKGLAKVADIFHPEIRYVKLDHWDTWNMDGTLARIILPMLKQLNETKHGSPFVDDEDVPDELKSTNAPPKENEWDTDDNHHKRWEWVMKELIWTFDKLHPDSDWEDQFHSGVIDWEFKKLDETTFNPLTGKQEGLSEMVHGPKHTAKFDVDGYKKFESRIQNGLRLFGKYYRGLWD